MCQTLTEAHISLWIAIMKTIEAQIVKIIEKSIKGGALRRSVAKDKTILFDTEGASGGKKWKKLAPSTIKRKGARDNPSRVLYDKGYLEETMSNPKSYDISGNIELDNTFKSNKAIGYLYANDERPFLGLTDAEMKIVTEAFAEELSNSLKGVVLSV